MSETLIYYLVNTLLRGGIIVALLLILELFLRRKLVFAGGRKIFFLALLLIVVPVGRIEWPKAESKPAYCIEVPDWNVTWEPKPETAVPAVPVPQTVAATMPEEVIVSAGVTSSGFSDWKWTLFDALTIIYMISVLFLLAKQIRHYFIWRNRIRRCIAITGGRVFDVFLESKRLAGLERFPVMLLDGGDMLPVAACFGTLRRGAVLCPLKVYGKYTDSELRMILIHELEHLRRNDNPVAFFLMMLSNCFFINPFVRIIATRWTLIAELDCDKQVKTTLGLDRQGMAQYAGLLLASQTGGNAHVPGHALGASARNLKLRIQEFVMKRTKLQLLWYFLGICALFVLGSFLMPELRADTREPINPLVAENLPAKTAELVYFNGAALDRSGGELLEKAVGAAGNFDRKLWEILSMMLASEKNKGHFYMASVPGAGWFMLVKNGADSEEMIIPPRISGQGMAARRMAGGYFALYPSGGKLPAMGLPEELRRKIAAAPGEVLRSCKAGETAFLVSVVNHNGVYTLSTIQQDAGKEALTLESIADKAVSYVPEDQKDAKKAFIKDNLKISAKPLNGKNVYELEFPLNEKTLTFWSDFIRKGQEDRAKENAPKVIALYPENGATNVDSNLKEIKVTFDRPMNPTSWSFCQKSTYDFPGTPVEGPTMPSFDGSHTVITMPVRLVPERTYNIYLNSPPFLGFRSAKGGVLQAVHYTFTTGK